MPVEYKEIDGVHPCSKEFKVDLGSKMPTTFLIFMMMNRNGSWFVAERLEHLELRKCIAIRTSEDVEMSVAHSIINRFTEHDAQVRAELLHKKLKEYCGGEYVSSI